jgi:hypothetical protein
MENNDRTEYVLVCMFEGLLPDPGAVFPLELSYEPREDMYTDDPCPPYYEDPDPGAIDTDLGYDDTVEPGDEHYWMC